MAEAMLRCSDNKMRVILVAGVVGIRPLTLGSRKAGQKKKYGGPKKDRSPSLQSLLEAFCQVRIKRSQLEGLERWLRDYAHVAAHNCL